ncbi:hypothetical protein CPAST_c25910 [Clostridium pasteurianum DSM 525 = ATCC 6013]|uniref:Uncharacterized protein n=2 Tax=Clostridium pasteurianum TaxID=1501 RepID=A0A0H3JAL1_CLOPA|nr:hypothetical protein [Clostridium pasteurianum]AJA48660.1 hypothetical protein CPAST_c25910 [Clostridium pasteurianum DSM 525 = ATCC 6013]AJA52648.1 hypothetical protein CLPA_c25910 [Clostridium pasteurianum DSM 525 = ATCC 6013]AOZ75888.1 hypothetical protein AQ983_12595 [Clostridium pasteurianum DSM 525 = ATCC 6013]AOZ79684.1 hypothetical protein AQ984_12590 [Clostridium pasteurianum]ELP59960.1 hypothetical protein F502_04972 [Clostridium pasteurianum DSM 525 = ATCC 6013]
MMLYVTDDDSPEVKKWYRLYTYFACATENTWENFLNSIDCLEILGYLKDDKEILKEVTKTRFNLAKDAEFNLSEDAC